MNITILGTGTVAINLAHKCISIGYTVFLGTRNVENTMQKIEQHPDSDLAKLVANNACILETFSNAASQSKHIICAVSGAHSVHTLRGIGSDELKGKIIIDISNPLDFSNGFPPTLTICNDTSLAEQIQAVLPHSHVVKTLNTVSNNVMVAPEIVPGNHTLFLSGNSEEAKQEVIEILQDFGWKTQQILDLGDITTARGTEMYLPLWVRLFGTLSTDKFNIAILKN